MLPLTLQPDTTVTAVQVIPDSAPQDVETTELLDRLRTDTIPPLEEATGVAAYVGGFQAVTSDFTDVINSAMPLFLAVVVGLGFLALVILFRSIIVPLTGRLDQPAQPGRRSRRDHGRVHLGVGRVADRR